VAGHVRIIYAVLQGKIRMVKNRANANYLPDSIESVTLSRNLNLFTITMIGVGGMIGAGIFVLTGIAAGVAGPGLILAFLLNGVITTLTAMAYAELGSAFPEAGGGYLWVKEGLGGVNGFLSGWMSWFAHVVAGCLYALGFGRFASELWRMAGLSTLGLSSGQLTLVMMTFVVVIFTLINYRGASETGSIGNIVTLTKIIILATFVLFGLLVISRTNAWQVNFTGEFLPNGFSGVFMAMGLTFVAFEGYEIIAQSGEEVNDPYRNIPRAIFLAIIIAIVIYLLVGFTVIGATIAPEGMKVYQYLGRMKEVAIVEVAQQIFPLGIGAVLLLISGMVSTMSALNATTFSSSRVSFAMGRDRNLPEFFAQIHPKRHTPHWAVVSSGGLMLLIAWLLPIEGVAAAADIMFLLLFLQVNVTLIALRRRRPDLKRGFQVPGVPFVPILAIIANGALVINLLFFNTAAWVVAVVWIVIGILAYFTHFARIEAMEKPREVLHEEVLVSRDYSVTVPIVNQEQARILGQIGTILAQANQGEILALHVVRVPVQLTLGEGRLFLKEGHALLDTVIQQAKKQDIPVHTVIRLGRDVPEAIKKTVEENASNLLLLGWPGYTESINRMYGSVIDPLVDNPPVDIAVVRYRKFRPIRTILVPVGGGPNSHKAVQLAVDLARNSKSEIIKVYVFHILPVQSTESDYVRAEQVISEATEGIHYELMEPRIVQGETIVETILEAAENVDLIIIGGSEESPFKHILFGNIPEQVARRAKVSVILMKRRSSVIHSFIHRTSSFQKGIN
jgi:amino acid transporter/nucleotide-binding universal stress UspA family protein